MFAIRRALLPGGAVCALVPTAQACAEDGKAGDTDILVTVRPVQALTLPTSTGSRLSSLETPASVATLDGDAIRAAT